MNKKALVIGASGDVGRGIVNVLLAAKWQVIAAARSLTKLEAVTAEMPEQCTALIQADIAAEAGAEQLALTIAESFSGIDAVIVCASAPVREQPLLTWSGASLLEVLNDNVITHFNAAKYLIPKLNDGGMYIGIGGGTADFLAPQLGHVSMCQSALRMMYRALAKENKGVVIKELMILSMVNGASRRDIAEPSWLTEHEVGRHVLALLREPGSFPASILMLQSREQVGLAQA